MAAQDLPRYRINTPVMLRLEKRSATIFDGSLAPGRRVGSTLPARHAVARCVTDVRLLAAGWPSRRRPDAAPPPHLADSALVDLARVGDVVDVLPRSWPPTPSWSLVWPSRRPGG